MGKKEVFNPEFPLGNLMEKKQFLWDFCSLFVANSELLATKSNEKRRKAPKSVLLHKLLTKMRLMENLGLTIKTRRIFIFLPCFLFF